MSFIELLQELATPIRLNGGLSPRIGLLYPFGQPSSDTREPNMTDTPQYTPPEVWVWEKGDSPNWRYSNTNRPVAGATHEKELPRGKHPLQLYSLGTPNGVKVTIMLEELLAAGHSRAEYDAWLIRIGQGDQFGSGFVGVNPNSKIPALMDYSEQPPRRVFESGAILLYLADKFGAFLPKDRGKRTEALNWLFWQMGSTPYVGGGFGRFYAYAPVKIKYAIDRFTMEVKRLLDVLDQHQSFHRRRRIHDRRHGDLAVVRQRHVERRFLQRPAQVPADARI